MFNLEEEIKAWKYLLDTGEIDEITYNEEINKLKLKDEKRKNHKKIDIFNLLKNFLKIFMFLIVCMTLVWIYKTNNVSKNIEYVKSLSNIPKPSQIKTSGNITKIINGSNVEINYVAKYSISGRVVDVQNYYGYDIRNNLSPKDIGISWGFLANEKNHRKVTWSSAGNRYLSWYSSDGMWINEMGGTNKITEYCSNNHLIPSDNKNKKLIDSIKEGDFVRIEGYLVNVYCKKSDGSYFNWNTSTSRNDTGNGACEIVYVTNITWLEKE